MLNWKLRSLLSSATCSTAKRQEKMDLAQKSPIRSSNLKARQANLFRVAYKELQVTILVTSPNVFSFNMESDNDISYPIHSTR